MTRSLTSALLAITLTLGSSAVAVAQTIQLSSITKYEVISTSKVVAYSGEKPNAFIQFSHYCSNLKIGSNFTLRTFVPSIKKYDTIILDGKECSIGEIELIRQN